MKTNFLRFIIGTLLLVCLSGVSYGQDSKSYGIEIDSLINLLQNSPDSDEEFLHLLQSISFKLHLVDPVAGKAYGEKMIGLANKQDKPDRLAEAYNNVATNYTAIGQYPKALEFYTKAQKLAEEINYDKLLTRIYSNMGYIYELMEEFDKAKGHYDLAIGISAALKDSVALSNSKINMATMLLRQKKYRDGIAALKEVRNYCVQLDYKTGLSTVLGNIGYAFTQLNEPDSAIPYALMADSIDRLINNQTSLSRHALNLGYSWLLKASGTTNMAANNKNVWLNTAIEYLSEAKRNAQTLNQTQIRLDALSHLVKAYSLFGQSEKALEYANMVNVLADSVYKEDMRSEITKLEARQEIELLEAKEATTALQLQLARSMQFYLLIGVILVSTLFILLLGQYRQIQKSKKEVETEKDRSDKLLLNILPAEVAHELKNIGSSPARSYESVTVLFTDFVNFTGISEKLTAEKLVEELNICFREFDRIVDKWGLEKIKTIGDAYMAVCGLPYTVDNHAEKTVLAAIDMCHFIKERKHTGGLFEIRIGIHTGPVVAGIVGNKKFAYDIWGDTVNMAARMEQNSEPGKINVSQSTRQLLPEHIQVTSRGDLPVKNKGVQTMYFIYTEVLSV